MNKIDKYLQAALGQKASDLHFVSGDPVRARVHGGLQPIMEERLTIEVVREAMVEIMDGVTQKSFEANDAADFAYEIEDVQCISTPERHRRYFSRYSIKSNVPR
jgi:Tfp pilus assembly pilus retraction ATPase PilT